MAYQTGTATGIDDLVDKIRIFLNAQGWTIDKWVAPSSGYDAELYVSNGEVYVSMDTNKQSGTQAYHGVTQVIDRPYLRAWINGGFNTSLAVDNQPNNDPNNYPAEADWLLEPMTVYHFFEDDIYFHCVVETIPGEYVHFGWGQVEKLGTFNYGTYVYGTKWAQSSSYIDEYASGQHCTPLAGYIGEATNYCSKIMHDIEGVLTHYRISSSGGIYKGYGPGRFGIMSHDLWSVGPNNFNGLTTLQPPWVFTEAPSSLIRPVGQIKDMRSINVKAFSPGDTWTIGGDTWYIFPTVTKKDPDLKDNLPNSGWLGWAFKRVNT
jgi:hypothetical protein